MYLGNAQNIYNLGRGSRPCIAQTRGVSGFIEVGGQVVMKVVMRRAATTGGAFYSAKKWGAIAPPALPSLTPLFNITYHGILMPQKVHSSYS